jgi:hypothetical protein
MDIHCNQEIEQMINELEIAPKHYSLNFSELCRPRNKEKPYPKHRLVDDDALRNQQAAPGGGCPAWSQLSAGTHDGSCDLRRQRRRISQADVPDTSRVSLGIFDVLAHLHTDRWWKRAWIFQEEYLSSTSMPILVRPEPGLVARHRFGSVHREICLNTVEFRTQTTLFLFASKWEAHRNFAKKCTTMLKMFGRYDIQYRFRHDVKKKAMSPRNCANLQRRNVGRQFDRLPIIANSCNYAFRFASQKMSEDNHGLKLCPGWAVNEH